MPTCRTKLGRVLVIDGIAVFRSRKARRANIGGVRANRLFGRRADLGVAAHEARRDVADEGAEHVVRDDELSVDVRAGADAVHEQIDALANEQRRLRGDRFEQHRERTGFLQRERVLEQLLSGGERLSLHTVAAELAERLRGEAEVAHDGDTGIGDGANARGDACAAFASSRRRSRRRRTRRR